MQQIKSATPNSVLFGIPEWFHPHGTKLRERIRAQGGTLFLVLKSSAVEIKINPATSGNGWVVEYNINHSPQTFCFIQVWMSDQDLKTAFGLSDTCDETWGQEIINRYGGDVAHQGKYIRFGNYLNVPGPGTGHDGDPNVSILLSDEIKEAIESILNDRNG